MRTLRTLLMVCVAGAGLAMQEPAKDAPACHDYGIGAHNGRPAEPPNCACELHTTTDEQGNKICAVRHVGEGMPARCKNDCKETNCKCHPEDGCDAHH